MHANEQRQGRKRVNVAMFIFGAVLAASALSACTSMGYRAGNGGQPAAGGTPNQAGILGAPLTDESAGMGNGGTSPSNGAEPRPSGPAR